MCAQKKTCAKKIKNLPNKLKIIKQVSIIDKEPAKFAS